MKNKNENHLPSKGDIYRQQTSHEVIVSDDALAPRLEATNTYVQAATANNTRKAYRSDIQHYEQWGGRLPAATEHVVAYIQAFASKLNPRTLSRRLTALKNWHSYQGFDDPTSAPLVRKTLKGITNTHGQPKEKAPALTPDHLMSIVEYLEQEDTLTAKRDNALLQLGYFGAFRRSELVAIDYDHIERHAEGIEIIIPRSKTDQSGEGQHCAIPLGNDDLCPISALDIWIDSAEITEGSIFRRINRWNKVGEFSLTPLALTQIIKKHALTCEIPNAENMSSHSLRRGLATSASVKGASLKAIMRQGRWQHVSTVLGYIEEGQRFEDNAATAILHDDE